MTIKIELHHKTLGICATEIVGSELLKEKMIAYWKMRYGKTMDICTIVSKVISYSKSGRQGRAVIHKATGERYESVAHAAHDFKLTPGAVNLHCIREMNPHFANKFKYA